MAMLDIQKRHAEVFRIRFGEKGPKGEPRKLTDSIRITSANSNIVEAFVDVYGGTVKPWDKQFEAYLPTDHLRILVLPGQSLQQWWESYSGSVCVRRCDGFTEQKTGGACLCPADIDARMADKKACAPSTRVNVLCPDVAVVGSGALVTHSMIAAETLPQSIAVAEAALSRGLMVPAVLRVVEHKGRTHFIVPQIEIVGVSLNELTTGEVSAALPHATTPAAITAGEQRARFTPVPAELAAPTRSIADQVNTPVKATAPRKNAAPQVPATNRRPRTVAEATGEPRTTVEKSRAVKGVDPIGQDAYEAMKARVDDLDDTYLQDVKSAMHAAGLTIRETSSKTDALAAETILGQVEKAQWDARRRHVFAVLEPLGLDDEARHQFVDDATGGATRSTARLTGEQKRLVVDAAGADSRAAFSDEAAQ